MYRYDEVSELGGVADVESLIDQQEGPSCGFESLENVVQLYHPARNDLSRTVLRKLAYRYGYLVRGVDGERLDSAGYDQLLQAFGIEATWMDFDHGRLITALRENRVAIAVVDPSVLDPRGYGPSTGDLHAIVVTNFVTDVSGRWVVGYRGMDSNFPGKERTWSAAAMELATQAFEYVPLLVTDEAARWSSRVKHYVLLPNGALRRVL
jgi:hypothetical protein